MKKLLFAALMMCLCFATQAQSFQLLSMDSSYTTFTPQVSAGARYYSKPYKIEGNYQVTISAYTTADTLVGGVSLWVSNDAITWQQYKAADFYPYTVSTTADTQAFANRTASAATSAGKYVKHWVFPNNPFLYYRTSWYSGSSGSGANVSSNLVTIKTTALLKRRDRP